MSRSTCLLGMVFAAGIAMAGPGHDDGDGGRSEGAGRQRPAGGRITAADESEEDAATAVKQLQRYHGASPLAAVKEM